MITLPSEEHWIDRDVVTIPEPVWRNSDGDEYIDDRAADPDDVQVGHRDIIVVTGTLQGSYPELGDIEPDEEGTLSTRANRTFVEPLTYSRPPQSQADTAGGE
ncbi:hypothetical protein [Microbacterium saperdae]|uniref:Uncharacterized protein n=1 Tax=Microbacterium saperdae TaxID=69368 RepID=A0A543BQU0_9MICO|nr:hypothetical protein [Microbacterium saperdae]TQL87196.1 hypothetical protein FB560_2863 [Microbacterium saperdae]GGM42162.1 hypothetical protein GCM10010489_11540 [Microbacterium saperdae]